MTLYGRNKTELTNIRSGPGAGYADLGDLYLNDRVEADRKDATGVWWHLTKITRANGTPFPLPATDCWAYGPNIEELAPPADKIILDIHDSSTLRFTINGKAYKATYERHVTGLEFMPE